MLICNYSYINQICGHNHSGVTNPVWIIAPHRMRGYYGPAQTNELLDNNGFSYQNKDSFPTGTNIPYSIVMGDKGALLSSTNTINGIGSVSGNVAMGRAISSTLSGTGDLSGSMSLIVQMASVLAGTGSLTATMVGSLQMAANLAGSGDLAGALGLIANISTTLAGTGTIVGGLRGTASLEANITPFTELSPESLSAAVMNSFICGTYTFKQCMEILAAVAAGKTTVVDLGGGLATVTFRDLCDTKDAVVADMTDSERTDVTFDL